MMTSHSPRRRQVDTIFTHLTLAGFSLLTLLPFVYIVLTSFKTKSDVLTSPPSILPPTWSLEAYQQVFNSRMLTTYLPNTIINALVSSLIVIPLAGMAGYCFSRYQFRGSRVLQLGVLGVLMLPGLTNLIPMYRLASHLDLLNTNLAMVAVHVSGGLPFSIWIAKSFFDSIPRDLEEAALLDGASPMDILRHIVAPLAMPGMMAIFLINFVEAWNEFLPAVVLLSSPAAKTVTVGLLDFQSQFENAYHVQAAACVLIALPVVILFLFTHRFFFRAVTDGMR